jgi:tyrosyl-tRNA synthetase
MTDNQTPKSGSYTILDFLQHRGLMFQATKDAGAHLEQAPTAIYCGFDPTADSLQLGNLVPIIGLKLLQARGHQPIILIGGATGLIGDPSGKSTERPMADPTLVRERAEKFKKQMKNFLDFEKKSNPAILVNNADWLGKMTAVEFMWNVGKRLSAKRIAGLESIKERWEKHEEGISLAEFVYTALQAYDFAYLYEKYGCTVQVGGSDQWGNIALGTDLVRKMIDGARAFGVTFPLIVDQRNVKLGKTEKGTVWLDQDMTSPYALHQYLLQTSDDDAKKWLKILTLLTNERIAEIALDHDRAPERRIAQRALADEVTNLVHGAEAVSKAQRQGEILFSGQPADMRIEDLQDLAKEPDIAVTADGGASIVDLILQAGLASSKRIAREYLTTGGIYWNGKKLAEDGPLRSFPLVHGRFAILRRGSRNVKLVMVD